MAQTIDQQEVFSDTEWWLEQWAAWVMLGMGSGSSSAFASLITKESERSLRCMITEDEALVIDSALATLKLRCTETGQATIKYYLWNCNTSEVARAMKINRRRADSLIKAGVAWIDAHLMTLNFYK